MAKKRKKFKGSLMIRLVDVVFILLFGFIAISKVEKMSRIELPKSETVSGRPLNRETVVFIGVLPNGHFLVENETIESSDEHSLNYYLRNKYDLLAANSVRMRVRIRANHDAAVKHAFMLVKKCQKMNVKVGIEVIKQS